MYRLQKQNVEKIADTKEAAAKLVEKGFTVLSSDADSPQAATSTVPAADHTALLEENEKLHVKLAAAEQTVEKLQTELTAAQTDRLNEQKQLVAVVNEEITMAMQSEGAIDIHQLAHTLAEKLKNAPQVDGLTGTVKQEKDGKSGKDKKQSGGSKDGGDPGGGNAK